MASDTGFEFDTSKEIRAVEAFESTLKSLLATINQLDRQEVKKLRAQFDALGKDVSNPVKTVRDASASIVSAIEKIQQQADKGVKVTGLSRALSGELDIIKAKFDTTLRELKQFEDERARIQLAGIARRQAAEATRIAKNDGASFVSTSSSLDVSAQMDMPSRNTLLDGAAKQLAKQHAAMLAETESFKRRAESVYASLNLSPRITVNRTSLSELQTYYAQVEADGKRLEAAYARINNPVAVNPNSRILQGVQGTLSDLGTYYARLSADADRIDAAYARLNNPVAVNPNSRILQGVQGTLADLGVYYTRLSADADRIQAAYARISNPVAVSPTSRILQGTQATLAELNTYYSRLSADADRIDAAWKRIANPDFPTAVSIGNTYKPLLSDLREYYTELQRVEDLKDRIRARRAGDDSLGSTRMVAPVSRIDAQDLRRNEAMDAMRTYYGAMEQIPSINRVEEGRIPSAVSSIRPPAGVDLDAAGSRMQALTKNSDDLKFALRGLASGFNAMWLTWGNIGAIAVGATISHSFVEAARTGMEVAHTLKTIEVLGNNTAAEVAALNSEMLTLARQGPFGVKDIATSMKVLSLAGLEANKILSVTKDVLNFSVAGTTGIEMAADTLISVSTAFGMGSQGFSRVADVISKAAAESKSSVESFANAMKTASVINKQYGVTLTDTATQIAALSQLGIQGTAAGTALRNMYNDLSGRTPKVQKLLKEKLGIDTRDMYGNAKDVLTLFAEFDKALATRKDGSARSGQDQKDILQGIYSERGAKPAIENLDLIRQKTDETGVSLTNALETLRTKIDESYGFAAISAAKMAQTAQSQFATVKSSLGAALNEAYTQAEPALTLIFDALKKTFGSKEFVDNITTLVTAVASLAEVVIRHAATLTAMAGGYMAVRLGVALLSGAVAGFGSILTLVTSYKQRSAIVAMESAAALNIEAAATARATAAMAASNTTMAAGTAARVGLAGTLARVSGLLPGIGTAISVGATAWMLFDMWNSKANSTALDSASIYENNVVKSLQDQASRLEKINALKATGITLSQAQQQVDAGAQAQASKAPLLQVQDKAKDDYARAVKDFDRASKNDERYGTRSAGELDKVVAEKQATLFDVSAKVSSLDKQINLETERVKKASKEQTEWMNQEMAAKVKAQRDLLGTENESATGGKGKGGAGGDKFDKNIRVPADTTLTSLQSNLSSRLTTIKNAYDNENKILDNTRKADAISEGEYQAQSLVKTMEYLETIRVARGKLSVEGMDSLMKQRADLNAGIARARAAGATANVKDFEQRLKNVNEAWEAWENGSHEKMIQTESDAMARFSLSAIRALDSVMDLKRELRKQERDTNTTFDKTDAAFALEQKYKYANPSIQSPDMANKAGESAYVQEFYRLTPAVEKANEKLAEMRDTWATLEKSKGLHANVEEFNVQLEAARTNMDEAQKVANEANRQRSDSSGRVQGQAKTQAKINQEQAFSAGIADALIVGIEQGAPAGAKALKKFLQQELLMNPLKVALQAQMNDILGLGKTASSGSSGGGWLSTLVGAAVSYFGGGTTAPTGTATSLATANAGYNTSGMGAWTSTPNSFDVGTPYVPADQVANIHRGERIMTAAENTAYSANRASAGKSTPVYSPNININIDSRADASHVRGEVTAALREYDKASRDRMRETNPNYDD